MKHIIFNIFILLSCVTAQNIRLYDINRSNYPFVSSKIIIFNEDNQQMLDLDQQSLSIIENGNNSEIISLSCEDPSPPQAVSGILSLDLSASMEGKGFELAKLGAKAWVNIMNNQSDVSILGFSDESYIISDFTPMKNELIDKIDKLELLAATNFNAAFLQNFTGAIPTAERALHKPVIVLLTDGISNGDIDQIVNRANEINATIYCVVLFNDSPDVLNQIAERTGGFVFEQVQTEIEIIRIYRNIFKLSEQLTNCEVSWRSDVCDKIRDVNINYADSLFGNTKYEIVPDILPQISYTKSRFVVFDNLANGEEATKNIEIRAEFDDITINEINSNNPLFTIDYPNTNDLPLTIEKNDIFNIRVKFDNNSEKFEIARYDIVSNACIGQEFFASGGNENSIPGQNSINLTYPNGGQTFAANSSNTITWEGTLPESPVSVEFSNDNGMSWEYYDQSINFNYPIKFPDIESDSCLIRVTQFSEEFGELYLSVNTDDINVNAISWKPNGLDLLSGNIDGKVRVINSFNGTEIIELDAHNGEVKDVIWSPDGIRFASAGEDGILKIWNSLIYSTENQIAAHQEAINKIEWSDDGKLIVTASEDNQVKIWDGDDYSLIQILDNHTQGVNSIKFSPNQDMLATCGNDSTIKIYQTIDWDLVESWKAEISDIRDIDWINNQELISVSDRDDKNYVKRWTNEGELISEIEFQEQLYSISVNQEKELVVFGGGLGNVYLYNLNTNLPELSYPQTNIWTVQDVTWSPEGSRFAVGIYGQNEKRTIDFYSVDRFPSALDISDSVFSLKKPNVSILDIDMGNQIVGQIKEFDVYGIFSNLNEIDIQLLDVRILLDDGTFDVITNVDTNPSFTKFFFKPKQAIEYSSKIEFETNIGTFTSQIIGKGVIPEIGNINYDFGEVLINTQESTTINLINSSDFDVNIFDVSLIGPELEDFNFNVNQNVLKSGEELNLNIFYSPNQIGFQSSIIKIDYDGENSPAYVSLLGKGVQPSLELRYKDTFFISCNSDNIFSLELLNNGIGNLNIINSNNNINSNSLELNNITINENDSLLIEFEIPFDDFKSNFDFNLSINSNIGDTLLIIPVVYLNTDYEIQPANGLNFFQNKANFFETKLVSVVNTGETRVQLISDFPIELEGGLFSINNPGPFVIEPNQSINLEVDFIGAELGESGSTILDLLDTCGIVKSLDINWNIQSDDNPIRTLSSISFDTLFCKDTSSQSLEILNISDQDINDIKFILDDPNNVFQIDNFPNTISNNNSEFIEINFNSDINGVFNATLIVEYLAYQLNIDLKAVKEIIEYNITQDELLFDLSQNNINSFDFYNTGSLPIEIPIGKTFGEFQIISSILNPVPAGTSSSIEIQFNGSKIDSNTISIDSRCGILDSIKVRSIDSPKLLELNLSNIDANIGDIINIPININHNTDNKEIGFIISYNKTILDYLGSYTKTETSSFEIIDFDGIDINSSILPGEFKVLWGNDSTTKININLNDAETEVYSSINLNNSTLRVLDLCYEGGVRLYFSPDLNINIGPNPINDKITLSFFSNDKIEVKINLFNMLTGESYFTSDTIIDENTEININSSNLPPGAYLIELKTEELLKTVKLIKD
ncbi:VWA domain-containing protein [Candidatus Kapabacteria bacterium]|nr:VWA domain-containing protein [Candidatus Kapabacteria bacterium]